MGSTHVALAWSSVADAGEYVTYRVLMNGSPAFWAGSTTSFTIVSLEPQTTYTLTVQARDFTTPPTTPANLTDNA